MATEVTSEAGAVFIGPDDLSAELERSVLAGAAVAETDWDPIDVAGPGAVQCVQGILTNDVEAPGPGAFVYGAALTPKGMIVSDLWVACRADRVTLFAPTTGRDAALAIIRRTFPPRLARAEERGAAFAVLRLVGPEALRAAADAGLAVPEAGRVAEAETDVGYLAGRPALDTPFRLQLTLPRDAVERVRTALHAHGVTPAGRQALELARLLAGFPALGSEIDRKTLPQEVRYDELEGVSYAKGCYTGQETVSRLHFRGHANRRLVGLHWDAPPERSDLAVAYGDKVVGRVTGAAWLHASGAYRGLALVRREVAEGQTVTAAGAGATVVPLPIVPGA